MKKEFVSLERALSKLGLASRAEARALVREGHVAVAGRPVTDPLFEVVPERALQRSPEMTHLCSSKVTHPAAPS